MIRTDITIYIAAMGIAIGAALVMLIALGISLACLCVKSQKTKVYGKLIISSCACISVHT